MKRMNKLDAFDCFDLFVSSNHRFVSSRIACSPFLLFCFYLKGVSIFE